MGVDHDCAEMNGNDEGKVNGDDDDDGWRRVVMVMPEGGW